MKARLGINPITWTNDDVPLIGGEISLETCLSQTRQAGFAGTELGGKFPRDTPSLRKVLDAHQLSLISGWYDGRICEKSIDGEFSAMLPHLKLLRDLGCGVVVYADTSRGRSGSIFHPVSRRPVLEETEWGAYGEKLTHLADKVKAFGLQLAFHHHMGTIIETDEEVDHLMHVTGPSVGLLFDSGHCIYSGGNPKGLLERHVSRVVHVHCKDVRERVLTQSVTNDDCFMAAVLNGIFTVPGDGAIDFRPLLEVLVNANYEGWLVVEAEQNPAVADPLTYATKGHDYLLKVAQEVGMTISPPMGQLR